MELVEYAQAVDHSRMPLLLRVLNALGWYAFLADIPLMAYAYCLVMARNGFPNLTMDEGRLVGASVLLPFVALALMSPAENWNPRGPKPKTMDEYVGDVWNLDGLAIAEPGYMDPLSGFPRIKGSYRVSWKRNGRRVEGTLGIDGTNVELRDNQGMIVSPVNPGTPVWKPGAKHSKGFARIGAALLLIAVGTLVFGACVLLTGTPLVVLFTAFVICSFIGSQLFGGAILVMEEDRRKQPTRRGRTVMKMSSACVRCKSVPSRELSTLILHRDTGITDPERPFKHECSCGRWFTALDWHLHGCWTGSECQYDEPPSILHEYERFLAYDLLCEALGQVGVLAPIRYKHPSRMGRGRGKSCVVSCVSSGRAVC